MLVITAASKCNATRFLSISLINLRCSTTVAIVYRRYVNIKAMFSNAIIIKTASKSNVHSRPSAGFVRSGTPP